MPGLFPRVTPEAKGNKWTAAGQRQSVWDFRLKYPGCTLYIEGEEREWTMSLTEHQRGTTWLQRGGLRPTRQRLALAGLLVGDGLNRHVTAESLFAAAAQAGEKVSLATVYNTLRAFCEAGLLHEVVVDGARSYFDTRLDDHPHFYWEDSHALTDAPVEDLVIANLPAAPEGMAVSRVDVVIRLKKA